MDTNLSAIEINGAIDEQGRLNLDDRLPITGPRRVRVIVLYPTEEDLDEADWLRSASKNPAFDFLRDPEEDIYSPQDGTPIIR